AGCAGMPVNGTTNMAVCNTSALSVGQHTLTASYSGDTNFTESSTTSAVTKTVGKAATTTTVTASPSPAPAGTSVTLTAASAVTLPGAGTPTGTVTFFDGATRLGTGPLSVVGGNAHATLNTNALTVGRHSITASYGGDGDFITSTSTAVIHYVNTNLSSY